jgi:hypothetical protein
MTIWVLTEEYNDYAQHGEYFLHAWDHKPSREELQVIIDEESRHTQPDYIGYVLNGGGRIDVDNHYEYQWYILKEIK